MVLDPLYSGQKSEFFDDQQIFAQDLNNIEYTKIKTIRDTIAACISQPGVAIDSLVETALQVVYVDNAHFTVNPGTAIDKYGRIIYVPSNTAASGSIATDPHYHPAWSDRVNIAHGKIPTLLTTYYVNIYYTIQQDIAESGSFGNSYYTREYDSYSILTESTLPSDESGGICLASFQVNSSGEIINSNISDLRPLLLLALYSSIAYAREIFRQLGYYWRTTNIDVADITVRRKAVFSYLRRNEISMNVNFDVLGPPFSACNGLLYVYVFPAGYEYEDCGLIKGPCSSGSIVHGSHLFASATASHSFSIDVSFLSQDSLYVVAVSLESAGAYGQNVYVRNTIIDVS